MEVIKQTFRQNDIVRVLKIRPFFFLMLSEFFSQIAFNMQHFVIIFIIYEITKSNTAVSGVILSFIIPAIIFSFIAGVYVDRWNKKKVLLFTNLIRGVLILLFLFSTTNIALMYVLTFLIAISTQFFLPAEAPMIPLLVEKKFLVSANAVFAVGIFSTVFIGYIFSGPALIFLGRTNVFIFLAVLFFISGIFIELISYKKKKLEDNEIEIVKSIKTSSFISEIKEVLLFIRKAREVFNALLIVAFSQTIIFTVAVLGPGYVATILDTQVENLSWIILAPCAFGLIVGALIVGSIAKKINNRLSITIGFILSGVVLAFLPMGSKVASQGIVQAINAYLPHVLVINIMHIIVVLTFLLGLSNALIFVPANATLQTKTNEELRGRIYGFLNAFTAVVSFLPVAMAGSLADIIGIGSVLTGVGILIFTIGIIRFFSSGFVFFEKK
ncbi:MAG: MFS transporter [Candidatus Levybacteria bacterium]|nr:MFS transporter [Candidatus Levybacteria bacterium]